MLTNLICIIVVFFAGRYSGAVWKNQYLEQKRAELNAYKNELVQIADDLERKDNFIRHKWQEMVVDISNYQFADFDTKGQWTEADDLYLKSWSSAEKNTE